MEKYNYTIIEKWWRGLGCWDRQNVFGVAVYVNNPSNYLQISDNWWDSLTDEEKLEKYNEFFSEN